MGDSRGSRGERWMTAQRFEMSSEGHRGVTEGAVGDSLGMQRERWVTPGDMDCVVGDSLGA